MKYGLAPSAWLLNALVDYFILMEPLTTYPFKYHGIQFEIYGKYPDGIVELYPEEETEYFQFIGLHAKIALLEQPKILYPWDKLSLTEYPWNQATTFDIYFPHGGLIVKYPDNDKFFNKIREWAKRNS